MHELGSDNVLLALIVFEDASTQTCEPLYCIFAVMISNMVAILFQVFHGCNKFFLAVSLLNIHESKRFKKGAFRIWGSMPLNDKAVQTK